MIEKFKELLRGKPKPLDPPVKNVESDLQERYDRLNAQHETLLREYEELSKKYFSLKTGAADRLPNVKDEFAPKCVRKEQETWSYFRMRSCDYIPAFRKFLRRSGHWTRDDSPEIRYGSTLENLEPSVWFDNEKCRRVDIPFGCVFLVKTSNPKIEWLVVTEENFDQDWMIVG